MALNFKKIIQKFYNPTRITSNIRTNELSNYKLDKNRISVSGLSSGGFLAHLLHMNYPEIFRGVGIFAGGPYAVADIGNIMFMRKILASTKIDPYLIIAKFNRALTAGTLGDINLIKKRPVYIFYSKSDPIVNYTEAEALIKLYEHIGVENLKVKCLENAGHGLPVLSGGMPQNYTGTPYLINCDFEASREALEHIYSKNILMPFKEATLPAGKLISFDQTPFRNAYGKLTYLADQGYVYLPPAALKGEKCGVHLALHGCKQSTDYVGKKFIDYSGYMDWADNNKLIIMFPQTQKTLRNPLACWDWFGVCDKNYATRDSSLMKTLIAMIFALQKPE